MKKSDSVGTLVIRLLIITACAGLILGLVYSFTKEPIAQQQLRMENEARQTALPEADDFLLIMEADEDGVRRASENAPNPFPDDEVIPPEIQQVYAGLKDGNIVGYTMALVTKGFSPGLSLTVGIDNAGIITGVEIGSHEETPGLGANATDPEFLAQYVGADGPIAVVKTPTDSTTEITAITGATITSNAVTDAVNLVREFYETYLTGV